MERDLDETLVSQEKMLTRLGRTAAPRDQMKRSFTVHLARLHEWLRGQTHLDVLLVSYNDLMQEPHMQARRVSAFLGGQPDVEAMAKTVDPSLYRSRANAAAVPNGTTTCPPCHADGH